MAVTYAYTAAGYGSGAITATAPAGSGGVLVAFFFARDSAPTFSGDWTLISSGNNAPEAAVSTYITDAASPSLTISRTTGEAGVGIYRIDDASDATDYAFISDVDQTFSAGTKNFTDVPLAPDGVALAALGIQNGTVTATSPFSNDRAGNIGSAGWWARAMRMGQAVSAAGGGTFDAGTYTAGSNINMTYHIIVVGTAGQGPEPAVNLKFGDTQLVGLALGDTVITKAYLGDTLLVG